jgi:hypothetical protein
MPVECFDLGQRHFHPHQFVSRCSEPEYHRNDTTGSVTRKLGFYFWHRRDFSLLLLVNWFSFPFRPSRMYRGVELFPQGKATGAWSYIAQNYFSYTSTPYVFVYCSCYLSIYLFSVTPTWCIVPPWNALFDFSFLILDRRYNSLDGGSARRKVASLHRTIQTE